MIIFSFDCAIKNLGFCCIEVNANYGTDAEQIFSDITNLHASQSVQIDSIIDILKRSNVLVDSIFSIKYMNIFDLAAEGKVRATKYADIVKRLKYVLYCLGKQLPTPDVVLIEYQMSLNDKSRGICRYIEEYYLPIGCQDASITYAIPSYPLLEADIPENQHMCSVFTVNPSLKNAYQVDPSESGSYQAFIEKHNRNYDANKAHAVHNFKYFITSRGLNHVLDGIDNKLDDIADAFMQAYAWCKLNKIF